MVSAATVVLEWICPAFGVVLGNVMFSASYRDVRKAVERGYLGDLNPTPWAFMLGNCSGWVAYSYLIRNFWVLFGNAPGLLLSVWLNLGAAKLQYQSSRADHVRKSLVRYLELRQSDKPSLESETLAATFKDDAAVQEDTVGPEAPALTKERTEEVGTTVIDADVSVQNFKKTVWDVTTQKIQVPAPHENTVLAICLAWLVILTCIAMFDLDQSTREAAVGIAVNLNLVFFYGAPLSTIATVVSTRNTASIHVRTMITNTGNGVFWAAYGLAIADPVICVPNAAGAALGVVQIFLYMTFPRTETDDSDVGAGVKQDRDAQLSEPASSMGRGGSSVNGAGIGGRAEGYAGDPETGNVAPPAAVAAAAVENHGI